VSFWVREDLTIVLSDYDMIRMSDKSDDDVDCDGCDDGLCGVWSAVDFLELFPNSNLRRFDDLTVITLCHRTTVEKNSEQASDDGLLVDVCNGCCTK